MAGLLPSSASHTSTSDSIAIWSLSSETFSLLSAVPTSVMMGLLLTAACRGRRLRLDQRSAQLALGDMLVVVPQSEPEPVPDDVSAVVRDVSAVARNVSAVARNVSAVARDVSAVALVARRLLWHERGEAQSLFTRSCASSTRSGTASLKIVQGILGVLYTLDRGPP